MDEKRKNLSAHAFYKPAIILLVVFFCGQFPPFSALAEIGQQSAATKYLVALNSADDLAVLENFAANVSHEFNFSSNLSFQNIYTFRSAESLPSLEFDLAGHFQYLESDTTFGTEAVLVNDPGFTTDPLNIDKQWALSKAGFTGAWDKTLGSNANVVAVIDTGIDATHEDLKTVSYVPGYNFISGQGILPNTNSDDNGHGTLVAGVLGATPNNGLGIAGTNWQITLMPIKALDNSGKGDAASIAQAIVWAADHGANLINLSVGGIGFARDITLANAITYAFRKNIVIVAAAGNDIAAMGSNLDSQPVYPICDDNNENMVIGVAATDQNDIKADFSNYGKNCIDVSAPGKRILSTINFNPTTKSYSPNSYAYASGTSLAVPFVVGQAALLRAFYPWATNTQIRDWIIATSDPIDDLNLTQCGGSCKGGLLGAGRINAQKSIQLQMALAQPQEGDLVKTSDTGIIYQISGGQKRPVSSFVLSQRFAGVEQKTVFSQQLSGLPDGPFVMPTDGTLVKLDSSPTIYMIRQGQKMPVTFQVFQQLKLNFGDVFILSDAEVNSWIQGAFLAPAEGTLVRTPKSPTLYWVISGVLHPINFQFYQQRGLKGFGLLIVPDKDLPGYSLGEAYTL